jgi:uncharacterized membrane protein YeiB
MFLKNLEQKILFIFTRMVSLIVILGLFLTIILTTIAFFNNSNNSNVTYNNIKNELKKSNNLPHRQTLSEDDKGLINKYFSNNSDRSIINTWMQGMTEDVAKDFLINLAEVIRQTEQSNDQNYQIEDVINKYKDIKIKKISENIFTENIETYKYFIYIIFLCFIVGLIGLFSLILVLLAIERNTRKEEIIL